jgi:hypothetical protein
MGSMIQTTTTTTCQEIRSEFEPDDSADTLIYIQGEYGIDLKFELSDSSEELSWTCQCEHRQSSLM